MGGRSSCVTEHTTDAAFGLRVASVVQGDATHVELASSFVVVLGVVDVGVDLERTSQVAIGGPMSSRVMAIEACVARNFGHGQVIGEALAMGDCLLGVDDRTRGSPRSVAVRERPSAMMARCQSCAARPFVRRGRAVW